VFSGQVCDETYAAATEALGEQKLVDLTVLAGYYTLTAYILNAYRVPAPPDPAAGNDGETARPVRLTGVLRR
jgi:hypothetical protein